MNYNITYIKQYRINIADNNNYDTKNIQLKNILDTVFLKKNNQLTKSILAATINCMTGRQKHNINLQLSPILLQSIEFLTANNNNYWLTNSQEVTQGATQIIFATCYDLVKNRSVTGLKIEFYSPFTRETKISLVNNVINKLVSSDNKFPDMPRNRDNSIKFCKESYFDLSQFDKDGNLEISGKGYNYIQNDIKINSDTLVYQN